MTSRSPAQARSTRRLPGGSFELVFGKAEAMRDSLPTAPRNICALHALIGGASWTWKTVMHDAYLQFGIGMAWGVAIGASLGVALLDNIAMGIVVGLPSEPA